jgi:hypothetical protein
VAFAGAGNNKSIIRKKNKGKIRKEVCLWGIEININNYIIIISFIP